MSICSLSDYLVQEIYRSGRRMVAVSYKGCHVAEDLNMLMNASSWDTVAGTMKHGLGEIGAIRHG